jgi:hypothetical protein
MLFNLIGFKVYWFGLVILGKIFVPLTLCWLILHIYLCEKRLAEFKLITTVTIIGILVDSALSFFDVLLFTEQLITPLWLITLWGVFASTIAHSLQILSHSKKLQFIIGFIFPPLGYIGGASLSAVYFGHTILVTYFILAPIWGALMVLFFYLKDWLYFQENAND